MTEYRFACLAASMRPNGFCYAGKDIVTGRWLRPLTSAAVHGISGYDRVFAPGDPAKIGDIVAVDLGDTFPLGCQTENVLRGFGRWKRAGQFSFGDAKMMVDEPKALWENGRSTKRGLNDEMSKVVADKFDHSLLLIAVSDLCLVTRNEGFGTVKIKTRARFSYRGTRYLLSMTDPDCNEAAIGEKSVGAALVTCSVSEPWEKPDTGEQYVYKLAAGIITPERLP